jgi:hypothetical protein
MNMINKGLILGTAAMMLAATTASAAVVCNEDGDCWRVEGEPRYYEPSLKLRIMPDDWRWSEGEKSYRWREPGKGRGYWRGEKWMEIEIDRR